MSKRIVAYQCEYCGAIKRTQTIIDRHERTCLKNPNAINCYLCQYSVKKDNKLHCTIKDCDCRRDISGNCDDFKKAEVK